MKFCSIAVFLIIMITIIWSSVSFPKISNRICEIQVTIFTEPLLLPTSALLLSKLCHQLPSWSRETLVNFVFSLFPSLNVYFFQPLCYALIQTAIIFYFGVSKNFLTGFPSSILTPLQSTQKAKIVLKFKLSILSLKNLKLSWWF